jgi:hypothetical protein
MSNRQQTDNRYRYDRIVLEIRRRYPVNTRLPTTALRALMSELDIRAKDTRTQNVWLDYLTSPTIYGEAIIESLGPKHYLVLPSLQARLDQTEHYAQLVTV